ncbi:hypothetical protein NEISICOT_03108 [Neisseria sicca ATCC 29256]|uniref:Uncharacterized protein n=1 Tax=Neisseria sicca ATCC 29256 TaxID=547045 RepID=C6M983_NEISI|nr:hypothetical protein NEISICOT_03108 [Neisseria sicca ATCC 29256]
MIAVIKKGRLKACIQVSDDLFKVDWVVCITDLKYSGLTLNQDGVASP